MDFKFAPLSFSTVVVAATFAGSAALALLPAINTYPVSLRVVNNTTQTAFIEVGSSTVTAASTSSMPVRPTSELLMATSGVAMYVSGATTGGTVNIYVTPGKGI